jgi:SNF2 family DNA or RNA helicase
LAKDFHSQDVILTTYGTLRADCEAKGPLSQIQWHRLILDEGKCSYCAVVDDVLTLPPAHHIRNRSSQIFSAACSIKSTYRWCLTGTPIHNTLDDYGALLSFLRTPDLTERPAFDRHVTKPIQGKKKEGFSTLQALVRTTCLRRTKESIGVALNLPSREERTVDVPLLQKDQGLYDFFKKRTVDIVSGTTKINGAAPLERTKDSNVLSLLNFLRLICNHGRELLPDSAIAIWNNRDRTLTDHNEEMTDIYNSDPPTFSAKLEALLNGLRSIQAPNSGQERYLPVKRSIP